MTGVRPAALLSLVLGLPSAASAVAAAADPAAALRDGNRLFRAGRLEEALAAYAAGCDPRAPDPLLAYNLGASAHRLGRLPEAVLWYRRAAAARSADPWLADNLALARAALGTSPPRPATPLGWIAALAAPLRLAAVALAWTALGLLAWRRAPFWSWAGAALLAAGLYAAAAVPWRTVPAVLLTACAGQPAGAEVWVRAGNGGWQVDGAAAECPAAAVALVRP